MKEMGGEEQELLLDHGLLQKENGELYAADGSVDLQGKPVLKSTTGGWRASVFILATETGQRIGYFGIASNLITYLTSILHQGNATAASSVTTWQGTCFLTPLIGAFLADAYWGRYWTLAVFSTIYFTITLVWSKSVTANEAKAMLSKVIVLQIIPRMVSMIPFDVKTMQSIGIAVRNVWSGAMYNLFVFILMGTFFGAFYYHGYLIELEICLDTVFEEQTMKASHPAVLDCSQVHKVCVSKRAELEHGMFSDAFEKEIGSRGFLQKFIYCFVWGVRCLSSLGQIFDASFNVVETTFSCMVMVIGLIFLADLIARMQTSVQSAGAKRERQRVKQRRLEEWTRYHDLPPDLKGRVRHGVQSQWQQTKGIDDEGILDSLPLDLRRDIRTHLYKDRIHNITPFSRMDNDLLDFICGHLKTFISAEGTYIILQGDQIQQMVFIFSGLLHLTYHSAGRSNSRRLEPGEFFGEELLAWSSQPSSSNQDLPPSTCTVKCLSNVEAFCLPAEDVRLLTIFNFTQKFQQALREHRP